MRRLWRVALVCSASLLTVTLFAQAPPQRSARSHGGRAPQREEAVRKILEAVEKRLAEQREQLLEEVRRLIEEELGARSPSQVRDGGVAGAPTEGGEAAGGSGSVWDYLREKYDRDGDQVIQRSEYDREDTTWVRLDSNDDGRLDSSDFLRDNSMARMMEQMRARYLDAKQMTPRILHRYFQRNLEGEAERLERGDVEAVFAAYDGDSDGAIVRAEFDEEASRRGARPIEMVPEYDRFAHLLTEIDADHDLRLTARELLSYFEAHDENGDGALAGAEAGREPRRRGGRRSSAGGDPGPKRGDPAPDFRLDRLYGGPSVRLSSFRGEKPVALIFGSYT